MVSDFNILQVYQSKLSLPDFQRIAKYMEENYGIKLSEQKFLLVQNRLYKRLIANRMSDFDSYVDFLFSPKGLAELEELPNVLTTNKTEFFRESDHFDFLSQLVLQKKNRKKFFVWSAACSSGEEPYSIAFTLEKLGVDYYIFASDISDKMLSIAKKGIYPQDRLASMDASLVNRFFNVYKKDKEGIIYQVIPEVRKKIHFYKINLFSNYYDHIPKDLDFIFLRNVLIYFSLDGQKKVLSNIIKYLRNEGVLFLGHAEVIFNFDLPLKKLASSIYVLKSDFNKNNIK